MLLLAMKAVFLTRAIRSSPAPASMLALDPHWGSLTEWSVFERTPDALRAWTIDGRGRTATESLSHALSDTTPLARASMTLDTVENFRSVHEFAFPVERRSPDGAAEELWTDLRYCWVTRPDDAPVVRAGGSTSCAVWAGGLFDAGGRVVTQLVKIGRVVQRRPP
jgi:hypothetical protein